MNSSTDRLYRTEITIDLARRRRSQLMRKFAGGNADIAKLSKHQRAALAKLDHQIEYLENRLILIACGEREDTLSY